MKRTSTHGLMGSGIIPGEPVEGIKVKTSDFR